MNFFFKACEEGDIPKIKEHLERGVDIESKDKHGYTPLIWASM